MPDINIAIMPQVKIDSNYNTIKLDANNNVIKIDAN